MTNPRGAINNKEQVLSQILNNFERLGDEQDIEKLKQILYKDCSAIMLNKDKDDACSWFFPDYMNVSRYKTLIKKVTKGK